ncbi:MAG: membrane integrity-associated transporter subunit PqiC [Alphaproteobacteria bacterium]
MKTLTGLAVALLLLAGCGGGPDPDYYILGGNTANPAPISVPDRIGLAEVALPSYARKDAIATREGAHRVVRDDGHRWASPPAEMLTAALGRRLEDKTGASVIARPFPRGVDPTIQVKVAFAHLLRTEDGGVEMAGQVVVLHHGTDGPAHVERFAMTLPARGVTYEDYMASVSQGLDRLSDTIAVIVRRMPQIRQTPQG